MKPNGGRHCEAMAPTARPMGEGLQSDGSHCTGKPNGERQCTARVPLWHLFAMWKPIASKGFGRQPNPVGTYLHDVCATSKRSGDVLQIKGSGDVLQTVWQRQSPWSPASPRIESHHQASWVPTSGKLMWHWRALWGTCSSERIVWQLLALLGHNESAKDCGTSASARNPSPGQISSQGDFHQRYLWALQCSSPTVTSFQIDSVGTEVQTLDCKVSLHCC
jgi:hypothetical protein